MENYNPDLLFDLAKDSIQYKTKNSGNTISYNESLPSATLVKNSNIPYLHFSIYDGLPFIRHGFSTRLGGTSKESFQTLNLSFVRGDDEACVRENYDRVLEAMDMNQMELIFSDQVHETKIHRVTKEDIPSSRFERKLKGIDGLITNEPNLALITSYADCVPLYFVDPVNKAIGLSHSGWKGTVGKIAIKTLETMKKEFGTKEEEVLVAIGPSICFDCYEISEPVAKQFMEKFSDDIIRKVLYDKGNGKYQLDLWLTNILMLEKAGVLREHIQNSNICTNCNSTLLFSHRASKGERGNLAAFLALTV